MSADKGPVGLSGGAMIFARQGHLGSSRARARAIRRLSVAMERSMCLSVRIGAAARLVTGGKPRCLDQQGGFGGRGGNRRILGDQDSVGAIHKTA